MDKALLKNLAMLEFVGKFELNRSCASISPANPMRTVEDINSAITNSAIYV